MKEIGYHGTTQDSANIILRTKKFNDSKKTDEWLGHGVYFFHYKSDAVDWAKNQSKKEWYKYKEPAVLRAELNYTQDQLFDLDDHEEAEIFIDFVNTAFQRIETYKHLANQHGLSVSKMKHKVRCAAINAFVKINNEIALTMYTFHFQVKNEQIDDVECIERNQKQICVHKSEIIGNVELENFERS